MNGVEIRKALSDVEDADKAIAEAVLALSTLTMQRGQETASVSSCGQRYQLTDLGRNYMPQPVPQLQAVRAALIDVQTARVAQLRSIREGAAFRLVKLSKALWRQQCTTTSTQPKRPDSGWVSSPSPSSRWQSRSGRRCHEREAQLDAVVGHGIRHQEPRRVHLPHHACDALPRPGRALREGDGRAREASKVLMAAAPDLLDALQVLVSTLKAGGYGTAHADAAIAKATGETA